MDEFGSRIQHSDNPTVRTAPFMYAPTQMAYTIMWPIQDIDYEGNGKEQVGEQILENVL